MERTCTAAELAEIAGAVKTDGDLQKTITGVNSLHLASEHEISFLGYAKYLTAMHKSKAGAVLVPADLAESAPEGKTLIFCTSPDKAFSKICALFAPPEPVYKPGIHPAAFVHPTAKVAPDAHIGPCAVIDERAEIGPGCVIRAGAYVGPDCKIGEKTTLHPNVSIMRSCIIGKRVIIHSGTVIGADGFGYTPSFRGLIKIPQNGIVQIDDDVEIGANSAVDRARFSKTWVKKGVKIDNLVQVGHNAIVGESSALIGQCGVAGSAVIGRGVAVGAQAGINGHIEIGDGTRIIGPSAVQKSTRPGETLIGTPAESERDFLERHMLPRKLKRLAARIDELEEMIRKLTGEQNS